MKRILITRTDRLGDVILTLPVLEHIKRCFPESFLAFMVRPEASGAARYDPHIDKLILYDKKASQKGLFRSCLFARHLRKERFDIGLAMHPTNRAHLLMFLAGIPVRVGYARNMGCLLTVKVTHLKQEGLKHEMDYNADLLREAGLYAGGALHRPRVYTSPREEERIDGLMKERCLEKGFFALHPDASCPSKRWPQRRFVALAGALARRWGRTVAVVGKGPSARQAAREIVNGTGGKAVDLTGRLSVEELAELLRRCGLFISNDSGPVHLACAVDAPVIALFGRGDPGLSPERWAPVGKNARYIHKDVSCERCKAHMCERDFACLKAITVEEVLSAVEDLFHQVRGG